MFVAVLESERKSRGLTQAEMARKIGFSERAYRGQISGQNQMHPHTQNDVARALKSPRLAAAVLAQFEDNPFAPAFLDVDDHPALELHAALAELQEAIAAIERIDPCKPNREVAERAIDQTMDLLHLIPVALSSWSRAYGVDLWVAKRRNLEKLRKRGYVKEAEAA